MSTTFWNAPYNRMLREYFKSMDIVFFLTAFVVFIAYPGQIPSLLFYYYWIFKLVTQYKPLTVIRPWEYLYNSKVSNISNFCVFINFCIFIPIFEEHVIMKTFDRNQMFSYDSSHEFLHYLQTHGSDTAWIYWFYYYFEMIHWSKIMSCLYFATLYPCNPLLNLRSFCFRYYFVHIFGLNPLTYNVLSKMFQFITEVVFLYICQRLGVLSEGMKFLKAMDAKGNPELIQRMGYQIIHENIVNKNNNTKHFSHNGPSDDDKQSPGDTLIEKENDSLGKIEEATMNNATSNTSEDVQDVRDHISYINMKQN